MRARYVLHQLPPSYVLHQPPPSADEESQAQKHDFSPQSSYCKFVAKLTSDGKSVDTCPVLFALSQYFADFNHLGNYDGKAKSESLPIGWKLCFYISRSF